MKIEVNSDHLRNLKLEARSPQTVLSNKKRAIRSIVKKQTRNTNLMRMFDVDTESQVL